MAYNPRCKPEPESWWIEFVALPSDVPEAQRYKQLLKIALRRFGLKCKTVSGKGPEGQNPDDRQSRDCTSAAEDA